MQDYRMKCDFLKEDKRTAQRTVKRLKSVEYTYLLMPCHKLSVKFTLRSIEYQLLNADYRKREEAYDVNVYVFVYL